MFKNYFVITQKNIYNNYGNKKNFWKKKLLKFNYPYDPPSVISPVVVPVSPLTILPVVLPPPPVISLSPPVPPVVSLSLHVIPPVVPLSPPVIPPEPSPCANTFSNTVGITVAPIKANARIDVINIEWIFNFLSDSNEYSI
jgi:hypothetical protein